MSKYEYEGMRKMREAVEYLKRADLSEAQIVESVQGILRGTSYHHDEFLQLIKTLGNLVQIDDTVFNIGGLGALTASRCLIYGSWNVARYIENGKLDMDSLVLFIKSSDILGQFDKVMNSYVSIYQGEGENKTRKRFPLRVFLKELRYIGNGDPNTDWIALQVRLIPYLQ